MDEQPTMSIVCTSYKRPNETHVLIRSLLAQTSQDYELIMLHDGPDQEMENLFKRYQDEIGDRFRYTMTPVRYNDYGHTLREIGIVMAKGEYLLITNEDNYYVPIAISAMIKTLESEYDGVMFDMIHNYFNYTYFRTGPRKRYCDIGCVATRTEHARTVGWRDKSHDGDGTYIEDLTGIPGFRWGKIPSVLFVHN